MLEIGAELREEACFLQCWCPPVKKLDVKRMETYEAERPRLNPDVTSFMAIRSSRR